MSAIFVVLCALLVIYRVDGLAKWMTKEECGKELRVGEMIMGSKAKFSDKRTLKVYRDNGDILLDSKAAYIPGEELLVMLYGPTDNGLQYVFEASNAGFVGGGCEGNRRVANAKLGKLQVPSDATQDITIVAGWAVGYDNVKITPTFILTPPSTEPKDAPVVADTAAEERDSAVAEVEAPAERQPEPARPAVRTEPVKLSLRGAKPPPVVNSEATDLRQQQPDAPPAEAASNAPPVQSSDPSEPDRSASDPNPARDSRSREPPQGDNAAPFVKPPLTRQAPLERGDKRENQRDTTTTTAATTTDTAPAAPPKPQSPITASAKSDAATTQDNETPETVADVDAAIEKMQAMIKDMKKKRAEKVKSEPSKDAGDNNNSVGGDSKSKKSKKSSQKGKDNGTPIKLDVKKKGPSITGHMSNVVREAHKRARGEVPLEGEGGEGDLADNDHVDGEGEQEEGVEEAGEERELARLNRNDRHKVGKKPSQRRGPTGRLLPDPDSPSPAKRKKASTWWSSAQVLVSMAALGLVGLVVIALSVTGVFYLINHSDAVKGNFHRLFRIKQGQDKE